MLETVSGYAHALLSHVDALYIIKSLKNFLIHYPSCGGRSGLMASALRVVFLGKTLGYLMLGGNPVMD